MPMPQSGASVPWPRARLVPGMALRGNGTFPQQLQRRTLLRFIFVLLITFSLLHCMILYFFYKIVENILRFVMRHDMLFRQILHGREEK